MSHNERRPPVPGTETEFIPDTLQFFKAFEELAKLIKPMMSDPKKRAEIQDAASKVVEVYMQLAAAYQAQASEFAKAKKMLESAAALKALTEELEAKDEKRERAAHAVTAPRLGKHPSSPDRTQSINLDDFGKGRPSSDSDLASSPVPPSEPPAEPDATRYGSVARTTPVRGVELPRRKSGPSPDRTASFDINELKERQRKK